MADPKDEPSAAPPSREETVDDLLRAAAHVSELPVTIDASPANLETLDAGGLSPPPAPAPIDSVELPIVLPDHYALLGEHARGGMGKILKAHDHRLGRTVALKLLLSKDPRAAARFVREALVTARLQHPSIVPVHEAGRWPSGEPFYVMKFVSGRPLADLIRERHTVEERLALLPTLIAVAEAVAYAHSRRVIHRDLKPDNVLVGEFGETVVVDWGLAKTFDEDDNASLPPAISGSASGNQTVAGSIIGTPGYMAPEQAGGKRVDERADVYSLGVILYHALAGRAPYTGRYADELIANVIMGPPPPLAERAPNAPPDLVAIVEKAMARDKSARYPSALELAADLKRFQTGQLVAARRYSRAALIRRWLSKHRFGVSMTTAALVAVTATAAMSFRRVVHERDRADRERTQAVAERAAADAARAREEARVDELLFAQAQAALDHDPTAAMAWLKRMRPGSKLWAPARSVAADAVSRGVAQALLFGHEGAAANAAFLPDGTRLVSAGADGTVRLWDLAMRRSELLGRFRGAALDLAVAPDGKRVLATGADGTLRAWELDGRRERSFDGHRDAADALALTRDGVLAATASRDGTARVWDLSTGAERRVLAARGPARAVAFSPDGALLAVRDDQGVRLWEIATGKPRPLDGGGGGAGPVRFSPDGKWLAAGTRDLVRVWALPQGRAHDLAVDRPVTRIAFAPAGAQLAVAEEDGSVRLFDPAGGRSSELAHRGDGAARDVLFSPDGRYAAAARGTIVRVWDLAAGSVRKLRGQPLDVARIAFSADSGRLVSAGLDGSLRVWRLAEGEPETFRLPATLADSGGPARALSADGRKVAVAPPDAHAILWWPLGAAEPRKLEAPGAQVIRLRFSPDGARLAAGALDGAVQLWTLADGAARAIGRHQGAVRDLAFGPGGALATIGDDRTLRVWPAGGAAPSDWRSDEDLTRVLFAPDGRVVTAGRTLRVWSADGQSRVVAPDALAELALAPDGKTVAASRSDGGVALYPLDGGAPARLVEEDAIGPLAFIAAGPLVALGGRTGVIRLRDPASGREWTLAGHRTPIVALDAAADGRHFATLARDGTLRVWPLPAPADARALRAWLDEATSAAIGAEDQLR